MNLKDLLDLKSSVSFDLVEAKRLQRSLSDFVRWAWPIVEVGRDLLWNWHIDLICQELEKVTKGETKHLVICIPPGLMKSLLTSVFWPAWAWLQDPTLRGLYISNDEKLAIRDARRTKQIITDPKYIALVQTLFKDKAWGLAADQQEKNNFENTARGFRQCFSIGGKITGKRGDFQIIDDPADAKEVLTSHATAQKRMEEIVEIYDSVLSSRLNDLRTNPRVVIQQRLHPQDLAGELIRRGYRTLILQMEFDPDYRHNHPDDPRSEKGELLFPEMFPQDVCDEIKKNQYLWLTQYQQTPIPRGGSIIKIEHTKKRWRELSDIRGEWISTWDTRAGGKNKLTSSYAVGQLWFRPHVAPGLAYLVDQVRGKWSFVETLGIMVAVHERPLWNLVTTKIIEDESDGRGIIPTLQLRVPGILPKSPRGSKESRLEAVAPFFKSGSVILPVDKWVDEEYIPELTTFPGGDFDDQVDCTSLALAHFFLPEEGDFDWRGWFDDDGGPDPTLNPPAGMESILNPHLRYKN